MFDVWGNQGPDLDVLDMLHACRHKAALSHNTVRGQSHGCQCGATKKKSGSIVAYLECTLLLMIAKKEE